MISSALYKLRETVYPDAQRLPRGAMGFLVTAASVGLCVVTLYWGFTIPPGDFTARGIHLAIMIPLAFLLYPLRKKGFERDKMPSWFDYLLAAIGLLPFAWVIINADRYESRLAYSANLDLPDVIFGILAVLAIFEATRRTVGMAIVWLTTLFIIYAITGPIWPGVFEHRGTSLNDLIESLYMLQTGMFNFLLGIIATFVFTFMALGTFLQVSGGVRIFSDLALAVAGHRRGGPAKVSVISSALMGTMSGSTSSNVVTTGTLTIPLMKSIGFKDYEAGAIETVASLGGTLTPPMMGAGIYIMAAFTGIPVIDLLAYSVIPAILYYISLYFYIDIKAKKAGMEGMPRDTLPNLKFVLLESSHIFIPIIVLIILLLLQYTPFFASSACVVLSFVVSYFRRSTRMNFSNVIVALEGATRATLTITPLAASAAVIYGVITITGLLVKVTSIILTLSGGNLFIGVLLIAAMSYILGMGLPITAAYVLIATLGVPALGDLGLSMMAAHLIIYWFSQDSTITPPICLTAFVAARIAESPPMKTGWQSVVMAKALYLIPFVFAFGNLLDDNIVEILFDGAVLSMFFYIMPMFMEGYWKQPLTLMERGLFFITAICFFIASLGPAKEGWVWLAPGALVGTFVFYRSIAKVSAVQSTLKGWLHIKQ